MFKKIFGTKNTGIHVAFTLCVCFVIIIVIDMWHCYSLNKDINMNFISFMFSFVTLFLGYIFGKG